MENKCSLALTALQQQLNNQGLTAIDEAFEQTTPRELAAALLFPHRGFELLSDTIIDTQFRLSFQHLSPLQGAKGGGDEADG